MFSWFWAWVPLEKMKECEKEREFLKKRWGNEKEVEGFVGKERELKS